MTELTVTEKAVTEQLPSADGEAPNGQRPRAAVSSGNPRITVAFPFSRIDIKEPSEPLRELAALTERLAEQALLLARAVDPAQAEEADRLAAQASLLARRLGAA